MAWQDALKPAAAQALAGAGYKDPFENAPPIPTRNPAVLPGDVLNPYAQEQYGNLSGMNAYSQAALRNGPSPFETSQNTRLRGLANVASGQALGQARGQALQAQGELAARGGLSRGAQERLQGQAAQSALGAQQGIAQQLMGQQYGLAQNEEAARKGFLQGLPGLEFQKANALIGSQQYDLNRSALEREAENQFNLQKYGIQADIYGGEKQAQAEENSGKK